MGSTVRPATGPNELDDLTARSRICCPTAASRFGVVVPVHDEERLLPAALASLDRAIRHVSASSAVPIRVVVVLDDCTDRSGQVVERWKKLGGDLGGRRSIEILEVAFRNVGQARRAGCLALLDCWSDVVPDHIWLATTDADSQVPRTWISAQMRARADGGQVWIGPVEVRDWSDRSPGTAEAWRRHYAAEHTPVHGANFGIDAQTYLEAGGFPGLTSSEDRALFEQAVRRGAVVRGHLAVPVATSGRRKARAPLGFAHALTTIEAAVASGVQKRSACVS